MCTRRRRCAPLTCEVNQIAPYFAKVECFCFEEQKLLAGEEVDMPLLFFIDKDVLDDPTCQHVDDVVLSYTFFRRAFQSLGLIAHLISSIIGHGETLRATLSPTQRRMSCRSRWALISTSTRRSWRSAWCNSTGCIHLKLHNDKLLSLSGCSRALPVKRKQ